MPSNHATKEKPSIKALVFTFGACCFGFGFWCGYVFQELRQVQALEQGAKPEVPTQAAARGEVVLTGNSAHPMGGADSGSARAQRIYVR